VSIGKISLPLDPSDKSCWLLREPCKWSLEMAKHNLVHNYLLVGLTEQLGDFVALLEVMLPEYFRGAYDLYLGMAASMNLVCMMHFLA